MRRAELFSRKELPRAPRAERRHAADDAERRAEAADAPRLSAKMSAFAMPAADAAERASAMSADELRRRRDTSYAAAATR